MPVFIVSTSAKNSAMNLLAAPSPPSPPALGRFKPPPPPISTSPAPSLIGLLFSKVLLDRFSSASRSTILWLLPPFYRSVAHDETRRGHV